MFDKMKALMDMQKKMAEVKKELENTEFEISSSDGNVKLTMNGAQQVKAVTLASGLSDAKRDSLQDSLRDVFNRAVKRSQEIAAQSMRKVTGFNIPGM